MGEFSIYSCHKKSGKVKKGNIADEGETRNAQILNNIFFYQ